MRCFDIDLFFDQICEKEPEEWFVLHMLGCEECRENFEFFCMIRDLLQEDYEPAEPTGEARQWMSWMKGDRPSNRRAVQ